MVRAVVFVYVLFAALATPALLFAAGGDPGAASGQAPGAPATETNPPTTTGTTSTTTQAQSAPAPAPAPPAPPPATSPAPQPTAAAAPAPSRPTTVVTAAHPIKTRAVAHTAGSATISDFQFSPSTITVTAGDSVTWSNSGPSSHSATADDGSFDTGILSKGQSGSHTFTKPGTYAFHCTPHPFMTGKVIVTAASGGGGGGSASSGGSGSASGTSSSGTSAATGGSTTGTATSSGSGLPNTGADTGAVALLGAILLGGGIVLRRRIEDER